MPFASNPDDRAPSNPTLAVLGFKRQIIYHLHFWALVAILPLVVVQWGQGNRVLSALLLLFCVNAILAIAFLRWRRTSFLAGWPFVILAFVCSTYSVLINGHSGLYWAYPSAAAAFFLLPLRSAAITSGLYVAVISAISLATFSEGYFWRISFSLGLTYVFVMTFAWLVGLLQTELTRLATTDPLTGCLNRSQLAEILNRHIQIRERYERVSSLVLLDLDYFKQINDRWGHLVGDRVLQEFSQRVRQRLRDSDQLFRIGGEEFMLVLPETRQKDAVHLAMQLLQAVRAQSFFQDIEVTASAGVSEVVAKDTWSTWLNRADQALYRAKHQGRNQVISLGGTGARTDPQRKPSPLPTARTRQPQGAPDADKDRPQTDP
ncbi:sensor domain-containing diguanylate cyclase [Marinobacter sp. X15-166B]|uniref:GGDEF domain-containing protein n=1 Tax=Marinobacter sp. X15-166B TaxID=1897620 RepID=UPI00085BC097|nr:GGDEF domain-containing protein [Marinobacter sp. X15-166B]OEY65868.1 diguanylate cyclase [Marinobacter sp. X15-166B]